jgi:hypothetical protein
MLYPVRYDAALRFVCLLLASCAPVATTSVTSQSTFLAEAVSSDEACKTVDEKFASVAKDIKGFSYQGTNCYRVFWNYLFLQEVALVWAKRLSNHRKPCR